MEFIFFSLCLSPAGLPSNKHPRYFTSTNFFEYIIILFILSLFWWIVMIMGFLLAILVKKIYPNKSKFANIFKIMILILPTTSLPRYCSTFPTIIPTPSHFVSFRFDLFSTFFSSPYSSTFLLQPHSVTPNQHKIAPFTVNYSHQFHFSHLLKILQLPR